MPLITSRQHPIVKQCRAVRRGDDPRLLLDGWHLLADALAADVRIDTVAVRRDALGAHAGTLASAKQRGAAVLEVADAVMEMLSPVRASSGVVALAARPVVDVRTVALPVPALVVVAVGLQDPGNVGAIVRSADAGGATGVLLDEASADPWGWKALRASMGSAFRIPVVRDAHVMTHLARWRAEGVHVVAADPRGATSLYDADLLRPLAIVLGGEGAGLSQAVLAQAETRLRIPMRPNVESLNVAVAAALLVYEAARQRTAQERP